MGKDKTDVGKITAILCCECHGATFNIGVLEDPPVKHKPLKGLGDQRIVIRCTQCGSFQETGGNYLIN